MMQIPHNSANVASNNNKPPLLWAEKYRPTSKATMCFPTYAHRLTQWLTSWESIPGGPPADTTSVLKRAALLSGSPGVGKTTSVYAVARDKGYQVIEFNASDQRSAKSLRESVGDLVSNRVFHQAEKKTPPIAGFFNNNNNNNNNTNQNKCNDQPPKEQYRLATPGKFILLMDEVDGLDRGGAGEIIQLIKNSKMPIVCTCNDRWHQKLRSLVNYCEDIRFTRPPADVVFQYLQHHVLPFEKVSVPERIIKDFIQQTGGDIRCVLNNLQMWSLTSKNLSESQLVRPADNARKNIDLGLFDAAEKFFATNATDASKGDAAGQMTIEARMQLYYNSDLIDLFVHENYLHYRPDRKDWLKSAAAAANSMAVADVISKQIFAEQTWGMGSAAAYRAAIYPCALVRGPYQSFVTGPAAAYDRKSVKFPAWLGQNSTTGKNRRIATIIVKQGQDPLKGFGVGSASGFVMDYCPTLQPRLAEPVATKEKEGIAETIAVMDQYHLQREDWDSLQELVEFKKQVRVSLVGGRLQALTHQIPGPIKAALTREFNKTSHVDRASCLKGVAKTVGGGNGGSGGSAAGGSNKIGENGEIVDGDNNDDDNNNNNSDGDDDDDDVVGRKAKKPVAKPAGKKAAAGATAKPSAKKTAASTSKASTADQDEDGNATTTKKTNGVRRPRAGKE